MECCDTTARGIQRIITMLFLITKLKIRVQLKKLTILLIVLTCFFHSVYAQEITVSGKVVSADDGLGLPGVSVFIKGTTIGVVSDIDGNYILPGVEVNEVVVFRFIGFETQEVKVAEQKVINVQLNPTTTQLEETVITALGVKRQKRGIGYSTDKMEGEEISRSSAPNVVSAMTGRSAGVLVSNSDGVEGGSTRITIRGNNNISDNNQPLIVVDGVPMENIPGLESIGRGVDWGSAINNVNAFDIESYNILKGGPASALYGSKGANGVILITTKSGKKQKGIGISYNMSYKVIQPYRYREVQNTYGHGAPIALTAPVIPTNATGDTLTYPGEHYGNENLVINQAGETSSTAKEFGYYGSGVSWGPKMDGQMVEWWDGVMRPWSPQPDNLKIPFQNGYTQTHNIAASGGNDKGTFRVSFTRKDHKPIIDNSNYNQTTINVATNYKISDRIKAVASVSYINYKRLNSPIIGEDGNAFSKGLLYSWGRSYKGVDKDNYQLENGEMNLMEGYPFQFVSKNLWWNYYNHNTSLGRDKYIGSVTLTYEPTTWLNSLLRAGRDFTLNQFETKWKPTDFIGLKDGYYSNSLHKNIANNLEFITTASKDKIFNSKINLSFSVGASSWSKNQYTIGSQSGTWYYPNMYTFFNYTEYNYEKEDDQLIVTREGDKINRVAPTESIYNRRTNSFFSFLNLSYDNYLFLDLTFRNDISSTLPVENNSYYYPSASLSFIASDAFNFEKNLPWVSFLKLRGGIAKTASDTEPYRTEFYYTTGFFGGVQASYFPDVIPPFQLRPQNVDAYEAGVNIGLLDNRVDIDATYYYLYSYDQILDAPLPSTSGARKIRINEGILSNKGIEVMVNWVPVRTNNLILRTGINFTHNRNKVVSLGDHADKYLLADIWGLNGPAMILQEGDDFGTISGYDYIYHENGQPIVDETGTHYLKTDTRVPVGNASPDFIAGWTTSFTYKSFSISTLIDTKWGGDIYCGSYVIGLQTGQSPETLLEREGGGLPYTDPEGNLRNVGVILDGVYADGTPNDQVVHYYYKYMTAAGGWGPYLSTPGIIENSWVKLREVSLTYTLPTKLVKKAKVFQNLSLSVTGRDLCYLYTTLPDKINPEGIMGAGNAQGFEWASFPGTRSFIFSVNANF